MFQEIQSQSLSASFRLSIPNHTQLSDQNLRQFLCSHEEQSIQNGPFKGNGNQKSSTVKTMKNAEKEAKAQREETQQNSKFVSPYGNLHMELKLQICSFAVLTLPGCIIPIREVAREEECIDTLPLSRPNQPLFYQETAIRETLPRNQSLFLNDSIATSKHSVITANLDSDTLLFQSMFSEK